MSSKRVKAKSTKASSSIPSKKNSGRPTDYDPKYCMQLIAFSKKPEGSFKAFAAKLFVTNKTIYDWAAKHPEFMYAKQVAKGLNEKAMMDLGLKGMKGHVGPGGWQTAWIFAMKARHGWREEGPMDDDDDNDLEFDHSGET